MPDGFFDYVEGITVNSQNGFIFFPEPEPFGGMISELQLTTVQMILIKTLDYVFLKNCI